MAKLYSKNTWVDEVLSGAERYDIKDNGGTVVHGNMQIGLLTSVVQAGTAVDAAKMNNLENGVDALDTLLTTLPGVDGWTPAPGSWTYASATTITVPAGAAAIYAVGDKIKLTQTTVKYFYIIGVANTLLTVTGGTDYTLANAAITSPFYSHAVSPIGFPQWFAWTPTITSVSGAFTTVSATGTFTITGKLATISMFITITTNGTAATGVKSTMPFSITDGFVWAGREAVAGALCFGQSQGNIVYIYRYDNVYPGATGYQIRISGCIQVA